MGLVWVRYVAPCTTEDRVLVPAHGRFWYAVGLWGSKHHDDVPVFGFAV